jgi:hypothetical protein
MLANGNIPNALIPMKEEAWCVKDSMFENEKYHK